MHVLFSCFTLHVVEESMKKKHTVMTLRSLFAQILRDSEYWLLLLEAGNANLYNKFFQVEIECTTVSLKVSRRAVAPRELQFHINIYVKCYIYIKQANIKS